MTGLDTIRNDLRSALGFFTTENLRHFLAHQDKLIFGHYLKGDQMCMMALLSAGRADRIVSKETLMRFFTGEFSDAAQEAPAYLAPKWLVRWVDGDRVDRYERIEMAWEARRALVIDVVRAEYDLRAATTTDPLSAPDHYPAALAIAPV